MKTEVKITYEWRKTDENHIIKDHVPLLHAHADKHITLMNEQGYTSGELSADIEDEIYRGWWRVEITLVE